MNVSNPTNSNEPSVDPESRLLLREETDRLLERLSQRVRNGGRSWLLVSSFWSGELRWARNKPTLTSDRRDIYVFVGRNIRGGSGSAMTNQIDDESLDGVVGSAEWQAMESADRRALDVPLDPWNPSFPTSTTWDDSTLARSVESSAKLVEEVTSTSQDRQLMSAGYIESHGMSVGQMEVDQYGRKMPWYGQMTQAQCTVTVRHPKGEGSGWAGFSSYDINKVDERAIAKRALDKCESSMNPVRIEPGRYTAILEPQAVADLFDLIFGLKGGATNRRPAEAPGQNSPFFFDYDASITRGHSKLGLKVVDERITVTHDPADPVLGTLPVPGSAPITWIKNGVLQSLDYERPYALNELNNDNPNLSRSAYRVSGGTTSIDEMIATTKRGLIVTRFSSTRVIDPQSVLATGLTRDGLWLVENGKITKAVRNFRFTESPLFVLNNIEQLGVPTPVYHVNSIPMLAVFGPIHAMSPVIVPAMKVNDFSFTSTIDAV